MSRGRGEVEEGGGGKVKSGDLGKKPEKTLILIWSGNGNVTPYQWAVGFSIGTSPQVMCSPTVTGRKSKTQF